MFVYTGGTQNLIGTELHTDSFVHTHSGIGVLNIRFFFPPSKALVNGYVIVTWTAHPAEFGQTRTC